MTKAKLAAHIAAEIEQLRLQAAAANIMQIKPILAAMGQKQAQFNMLALELIAEGRRHD